MIEHPRPSPAAWRLRGGGREHAALGRYVDVRRRSAREDALYNAAVALGLKQAELSSSEIDNALQICTSLPFD